MARWFVFAAWLTLCSCPPDLDEAPAYILVEGFELTTEAGEGASTADIREVWAFADGDFIGVFPLPARIPLFRSGPVSLRLEAGIRQDGRSVTPDIYPFYAPVERSLELVPEATVPLGTLAIGYRDEAEFGFVEDFEPASPRIFTDILTPGNAIRVQTETVRSGVAAGAIALSDTSRLFEVATAASYRDLNTVPINVWLEVDYLADAPTVFGVIGARNVGSTRVFDPGFLPRPAWTKIYFNLGPVIGSAGLDELRVALSSLLPDDLTAGTVYLDNVKLLYFVP